MSSNILTSKGAKDDKNSDGVIGFAIIAADDFESALEIAKSAHF